MRITMLSLAGVAMLLGATLAFTPFFTDSVLAPVVITPDVSATTSVAVVATSSAPTSVAVIPVPAPKDTKPVVVVPPTEEKKDPPASQYAYKSVMTTLFWAGEGADESNAYISNAESYWDERWGQHFGGVDNPECRKGYYPCGFTPRENPFYFALPYGEYDQEGDLKTSAKKIPWYSPENELLLKNHWIEVRHGNTTCYGQWEDVGPFEEDDFAYVFGSAPKSLNTYNEGAGLDISPALWDCLGLSDNSVTSWRFVDAASVPFGPWREIVTSSGTSW